MENGRKTCGPDCIKMPLRNRNCAQRQESVREKGLSFFFDDNFKLRGDAVNQFHGNNRFPDRFDGLIERDAALVDLETLLGERFGEVG